MNAGKLILINTSKSLLKEQGTEIFGRFFIALIAQAAQERATLPERDRLPVMVYIDEAQDYFDQNIGIILSQARKYRVGMMMAHQYLGQLTQWPAGSLRGQHLDQAGRWRLGPRCPRPGRADERRSAT